MNDKLTHTIDIIIVKPKNSLSPLSCAERVLTGSKSTKALYLFNNEPIFGNRVFEINHNGSKFISEGYVAVKLKTLARYRITVSAWNYGLLNMRAINKEKAGKTCGYFVRIAGIALSKTYKTIFKDSCSNPFNYGNASLSSQHIFEDLMMSIYCYPYVAQKWRDRLKEVDSFTPQELEDFLLELWDLQEAKSNISEVIKISKIS